MKIADQMDELNPNKNRVKTELKPCEDCISRAKAIEEADKLCLETDYDNEKIIEMLNDLPSVGKDINVTTNEDCISRQAVKDIICNGVSIDTDADKEYVCELIDNLPSVTPKKKTVIEVLEKVKEEIKQIRLRNGYIDVQGLTIIKVLEIIEKHLSEIKNEINN